MDKCGSRLDRIAARNMNFRECVTPEAQCPRTTNTGRSVSEKTLLLGSLRACAATRDRAGQSPTEALVPRPVEYPRSLGFFGMGGGNTRGMLGSPDPVARKVGPGALRSDPGAFRVDPEALRVDIS